MRTPQLTQRRVSDVLVVLLAVVSVALIGLSAFGGLSAEQRLNVFYVDVGICVLFAVEFLASWSHLRWRPAFLLRNWYDVLGMVPVAHPVFTQGGWTRVLWVLVVLARISRAVDRLVGERVTATLTRRGTSALVDAVKHPLTVAVLEEVAAVLQTGHYTKNIAAALDENREELKDMVREKIEEDRLTRRITVVPFSDRFVDTVSETTLRVIFSVLDDPRTDELISDMLRENITQMRTEVQERAYGDGRGAAAWTDPGQSRRSDTAQSAGTTASISAQASGVAAPDAAGSPGADPGGDPDGDPAGRPTRDAACDAARDAARDAASVADSTRPRRSPDPLARWQRPSA